MTSTSGTPDEINPDDAMARVENLMEMGRLGSPSWSAADVSACKRVLSLAKLGTRVATLLDDAEEVDRTFAMIDEFFGDLAYAMKHLRRASATLRTEVPRAHPR